MGWLALTLSMALAAAAGSPAPAPVWLRVPAGQPCGVAQVAAALQARLGPAFAVEEAPPNPPPGDILAELVDDGPGFDLRVQAGAAAELRRALPRSGACVVLSETTALMVERYLTDIQWTGAGAALQPVPPPPPPPPLRAALQVGAAASFAVGGVAPALVAGVSVRRGPWELEALGEGDLSRQVAVTGTVPGGVPEEGTLSLTLGAAELDVFYRLTTRLGTLRFGLGPGAELWWVSAAGNLAQVGRGFSASPFLGLRTGFELPLWRGLFVALSGEVRVHGQASFVVTGAPNASATSGNVDGFVAIGPGWMLR